MNIIQFLLCHFIIIQFNRMVVLLPELVVIVIAVSQPGALHHPHHPPFPALFHIIVDGCPHLGRGVAFEVPDDTFERVLTAAHYHVYMAGHDAVGIYLQAFLLAAVIEAIDEDMPVLIPYEGIYPMDHRIAYKV